MIKIFHSDSYCCERYEIIFGETFIYLREQDCGQCVQEEAVLLQSLWDDCNLTALLEYAKPRSHNLTPNLPLIEEMLDPMYNWDLFLLPSLSRISEGNYHEIDYDNFIEEITRPQ